MRLIKKLSIMLAVVCAAAVALPAAACSGAPDDKTTINEEGYLIASNGYRIPNVPDKPVLGTDIRTILDITKNIGEVYLYSGKEISELEVKFVGNNFYYTVEITDISVSDWGSASADKVDDCDKVELFMEYNNVDWHELQEIFTKQGASDFLSEMSQWQQRFEEVRDEIPTLYVYTIAFSKTSEEIYSALTEDPEKALEDGVISESVYKKYISGKRKYYAPAEDAQTAVTQAQITADGETYTCEIGYIADRDVFGEREEWDKTFDGKVAYNGFGDNDKFFGANMNDYVLFGEDGKTFTLYFDCAYGFGERDASDREISELTLKGLDLITEHIPQVSLKNIKIKYISPFGVQTSVNWDGESDITIPVRNQMQGEVMCRFSIQVTLGYDKILPYDMNWNLGGFLTADMEGLVKTVYCKTIFFGYDYDSYRDRYARAFEGVDIVGREEVFGAENNGPGFVWNWHPAYTAFYGEESKDWTDYVAENSYSW